MARHARVNEESHIFNCHPHVYPQLEWTIPAFTPQLFVMLLIVDCIAKACLLMLQCMISHWWLRWIRWIYSPATKAGCHGNSFWDYIMISCTYMAYDRRWRHGNLL